MRRPVVLLALGLAGLSAVLLLAALATPLVAFAPGPGLTALPVVGDRLAASSYEFGAAGAAQVLIGMALCLCAAGIGLLTLGRLARVAAGSLLVAGLGAGLIALRTRMLVADGPGAVVSSADGWLADLGGRIAAPAGRWGLLEVHTGSAVDLLLAASASAILAALCALGAGRSPVS